MTNELLIEMLQNDLKNERKHLLFYLQAGVMVQGLHREELGEFLLKEAKGELAHVEEFSRMIVHLGGVPGLTTNLFPSELTDPVRILEYVHKMETEVADLYAQRLRDTHEMRTAAEAAVHVFYEEQIADSWKTAQEVAQMLKRYEPKEA